MLLAEDITLYSDGGGKVTSAIQPIHKTAKVARFLLAIRRNKRTPIFVSRLAQINHQCGIINYLNGYPHSVLTFNTFNGKVMFVYIVINPEKLRLVGE